MSLFGLMLLALGVGIALRLGLLPAFPPGIHGDEGWTGLRGRYILTNGMIGVWDEVHSIGQPAGASYLNAVATALFGASVFSLRLFHALAACLALVAFAAGRTCRATSP